MAGNLLDLVKRRQFVTYQSADLREAISKTVAIEGMRGWRLGKSKASDRVDPVIALAMAVIATFQAGGPVRYEYITPGSGLPGQNRYPTSYANPQIEPSGEEQARMEDA